MVVRWCFFADFRRVLAVFNTLRRLTQIPRAIAKHSNESRESLLMQLSQLLFLLLLRAAIRLVTMLLLFRSQQRTHLSSLESYLYLVSFWFEIERCYAQRRLTRWILLRMGNGADEALFMSMVRSGSKLTRVRWQDLKQPYERLRNKLGV